MKNRALVVAAFVVFCAVAYGCETAAPAIKGTPAGVFLGEVKFKGEDQEIMLMVVPAAAPAEPQKGEVATRGARPSPKKKSAEKIKVSVPTTCEGFKYCLDDGSLLECPEGNWVQKPCACGCIYRNGNANCMGEYCKPTSQRSVTDAMSGTTTQEVCEADGCSYRPK
ncbi:MAG: hypothetical protein HY897_26340 [Deltaproteobacteria bacterium]|nr:hypothetical protein [Deltaproteobacteria bacterium]